MYVSGELGAEVCTHVGREYVQQIPGQPSAEAWPHFPQWKQCGSRTSVACVMEGTGRVS